MHVSGDQELFRRGLLVYLLGIRYFGCGPKRFGSDSFEVLLNVFYFFMESIKLIVTFRYNKEIYCMVFLSAKVCACHTKRLSP